MSDRPRHRAFLAFALSMTALFLAAVVGWSWLGPGLVEDVWSSPEGPLHAFLAERRLLVPKNLPLTERRVERFVGETLALTGSVFGLIVVLYAAVRVQPRRVPRWLGAALWVLAWWLAVETLAAPFLVHRFLLNHYEYVRDPDHWPEGAASAPGWNSDGLAQDREADELTDEDYVILFLGDSFTYGYKLARPHVDAFPWVVERRLRASLDAPDIAVVNFGWTSSSPLLSRRRLEAIGAKYAPDLVVLCIDMTDPRDDIWYRCLLDRRGLCAWFDRLPLAIRLWKDWAPESYRRLFEWSTDHELPYLRFFACEAPLDETRPFLEPMAANIEDCARAARALGAEFQLFVLPRYFQYSADECPDDREQERPASAHAVLGPHSTAPFTWFEREFAPRVDFPVHSLLEAFARSDERPHCFPDDAHWTPLGHRIAGAEIARQLRPAVARSLTQDE